MNLRQALTLFTCHALTSWSAYTYEFAVILFTAAAFPHGLRVASLVSVANHVATILLAPLIGRWIDHAQSRFRSLLATIFINKGAIVMACIFWQFIIQEKARPADDREAEIQGEHTASTLSGTPKLVTFSLILLIGLVENLSLKANLISMQRDWVPVLAPPAATEGWTLLHVNAMMNRIDLVCKMLAPPVVSQFLLVVSPKLAALMFLFGYVLSFYLEITTSERLYKMSEELQEPKGGKSRNSASYGWQQQRFEPRKSRALVMLYSYVYGYVTSVRVYFRTEVWAASLAMCLTYSSVLSLTGVMVIFLLDSGYSRQLITIAQSLSAVCELTGTFITPVIVPMISRRVSGVAEERVNLGTISGDYTSDEDGAHGEDGSDAQSGSVNRALAHTGLYGVLWLAATLLPALLLVCYFTSALSYPMARYSDNRSPTFTNYPLSTVLLLGTLAISRLGQAVLDLSTQQLGQSRVAVVERSTFAGLEMGFISVLGLGQHVGAAIFSDPRGFGVLATTSWACLLSSTLLFLWWMRRDGVAWSWSRGPNKRHHQQIEN